MPPNRYFSTASAAVELRCGRATVNRAISDGILPATDVSRTGSDKPRWRIAQADLEGFRQRLAQIREEQVPA